MNIKQPTARRCPKNGKAPTITHLKYVRAQDTIPSGNQGVKTMAHIFAIKKTRMRRGTTTAWRINKKDCILHGILTRERGERIMN